MDQPPTYDSDKALAQDVRDKFAAFKLAVLTAENAGLEVRLTEAVKVNTYTDINPDELKPEFIGVHRAY